MFMNLKKPVIRKVTVPVKKTQQNSAQPPAPQRKASAPTAVARPSNGHTSSPKTSVKPPVDKRAQAVKRISNKRKAASPAVQQFSSSSESESEDEDSDSWARKRIKSSTTSSSLEPDIKRQLWIVDTQTSDEGSPSTFIHGADLTSGANAKDFKPAFEGLDIVPEIELQYPSASQPERFELVIPLESDGYKPLEDIIQSIEHILLTYLPAPQSALLTDDSTGIPRRLKRALAHQSLADFTSIVTEFNTLVRTALADSTISTTLASKHTLPLPLVERILSQVYARTVSPHVSALRAYENGTDNVYGELLPRFAHQIFRDTALTAEHVFVDLGSGVGNVVLQAALEVGCESWGVEVMPNPAGLADAQAKEFGERCRRWGVRPGKVRLLEADFLRCAEIDKVMARADVVLVNNQAFGPDLNDKLLMKFLDLKEGAKVVSLKSFVPLGWEIKKRNMEDPRNVLRSSRREYWSGSVSWTDRGGEWFVAVKDSSELKRFRRRVGC